MIVASVIALEIQKHSELSEITERADFMKLAAKFNSVHELSAWQHLTGFSPPAKSLRLLEEIENKLSGNGVFQSYLSLLISVITDSWVRGEMYSIIAQFNACNFDDNFWPIIWVQIIVDECIRIKSWCKLFWEAAVEAGLFSTLWIMGLQVLVVTVGFMWARGVRSWLWLRQVLGITWYDLLFYLSCGLILITLML